MPDRPRVLVSDNLAKACVDVLEANGCTADYRAGIDLGELPAACDGAAGLLIRSRTKVTADLLAAAPSLRAVGRAGSGVDNVDLSAANERKVCVMNTPGGNARSVAEHAVGLMFALLRHIPRGAAGMRAGEWEKKALMGNEVQDKTLCIVGPGKIGRATANLARALGMNVVGAHYEPTGERETQVQMRLKPLDQALEKADIVSIHVAGGARNENLIDADAIAKIKPGGWIVNCARGSVIDERALLAALDSGHLSGAALDVFRSEPPPADDPLRAHPKVICTPHVGASTYEAQERVALAVAEQVANYLVDGTMVHAVNRHVFDD